MAKGVYRVTRFCCRSGMCIECRAVANGTKRKRVIHADGLDKETAERIVAGWAEFDAKLEGPRVVSEAAS